jgi:hypothetical protein
VKFSHVFSKIRRWNQKLKKVHKKTSIYIIINKKYKTSVTMIFENLGFDKDNMYIFVFVT